MRKILENVNWVFRNVSKHVIILSIFSLIVVVLVILYIFPRIDESPVVQKEPGLGWFAKIGILSIWSLSIWFIISLEVHMLKRLKREEKSKKEVTKCQTHLGLVKIAVKQETKYLARTIQRSREGKISDIAKEIHERAGRLIMLQDVEKLLREEFKEQGIL